MELYNSLGRSALHDHCRRQWLCLNASNLSDGIRRFVQPDEQSAYEALVGCLDKDLLGDNDDMKLAAYVASGKMRKHVERLDDSHLCAGGAQNWRFLEISVIIYII